MVNQALTCGDDCKTYRGQRAIVKTRQIREGNTLYRNSVHSSFI